MQWTYLVVVCLFSLSLAQSTETSSSPQIVLSCRDDECTYRPPSKYTLFIGVTSAATYFTRRQSIRDSWMKLLPPSSTHNQKMGTSSPDDSYVDPNGNELHSHIEEEGEVSQGGTLVRFIVGRTKDEHTQRKIEKENQTFGDLVQLDVDEDYSKLLEKTLALFKWANLHVSFHYLLKMDDDSFVRADLLEAELTERVERNEDLELIYEGRMFRYPSPFACNASHFFFSCRRSHIIRHPRSKFFEPESNFDDCPTYLPYASGSGYLLTSDVVNYLANPPLPLR